MVVWVFVVVLRVGTIVGHIRLSGISNIIGVGVFAGTVFSNFGHGISAAANTVAFRGTGIGFVGFALGRFIRFIGRITPLRSCFVSNVGPCRVDRRMTESLLLNDIVAFADRLRTTNARCRLTSNSGTIAGKRQCSGRVGTVRPYSLGRTVVFSTPGAPAVILTTIGTDGAITTRIARIITRGG